MAVKYMKMSCYGRYNSFRVVKIAMQEITDLFQYELSEVGKGISL